MELKEFIKDVLEQMEDVKSIQQKKNYLVEELEFELNLQQTTGGKVGVFFSGIGAGVQQNIQEGQKVKIKLTPKKRIP